ncbi:MAG TPA: 4a-hydroxytetrahydrobiopterin dehydratase [bacterium]|nr:4a-hydroxytetrahydrobiopterin dehydratase [bacterium]
MPDGRSLDGLGGGAQGNDPRRPLNPRRALKGSPAAQRNPGVGPRRPAPKVGRPLSAAAVKGHLAQMPGWKLSGKSIVRTFAFGDFYRTMGFVNALAYVAHRGNHHPDLEVGYGSCKVRYSSHELGGLSEKDFLCAAQVDGLLEGRP